MAQYSYIDTAGKNQFIESATPQLAIQNAPNIAPTSGVMLEQPTSAIPATSLTQNTQPISLPTAPVPTPVAMPTVPTAPVTAPAPVPETTTTDTGLQGLLSKYLGGTGPTALEPIFKQAQIDTGIIDKQKAVQDYTAQLGDITSRAGAASLSQGLRSKENVLGAISGAQGDIQRRAAIEAMPVQAALQAAQGNLQAAQQNLDTLFKIRSEDATNAYNYIKEQRKALYDFATDEQKRKLDAQNKIDDRKYAEQQANTTSAQNWAKIAFDSGQSALGAKIAAVDPTSPTYRQDIAALTAQIKGKSTVDGVAVKLDNGETVVIDKNTGKVIERLGGAAGTGAAAGTATTENLDLINKINIATSNPAFDQVFGVQGILYTSVPGTAANQAKAQITQIVDDLAIKARNLLKGQGAVSDTETQMLKNAQTAMNFNLSADAARTELAQRKGIIQLMSGIPATVTVTSPDGQTKTGPIDRNQMNEAIKAGYMVQFN